MNEDDSVRYSLAMQTYIIHLAESMKFWQGKDHCIEEQLDSQRRLAMFLEAYRRNEHKSIYDDLLRDVQEILGETWT